MSKANLQDYKDHLAEFFKETEKKVVDGREQNLAEFGGKRLLHSGAAIKGGAASLERVIYEAIDTLAEEIPHWVGEGLSDTDARQETGAFLNDLVEKLASPENAYRVGTRAMGTESVADALDDLVTQTKEKLKAKVRKIELGVGPPEPKAQTVNTINADLIQGAIQQAGANSSQIANSSFSKTELSAAIDLLMRAIEDQDLKAAVSPDIDTIRAQLTKPEPNGNIIQEAGKSVRTIVEGAIGGAAGSGLANALPSAIQAFTSALG
ncbi:MAG: hypothetical protein AAFY51_09315 [Pseudomonadota bacterium]